MTVLTANLESWFGRLVVGVVDAAAIVASSAVAATTGMVAWLGEIVDAVTTVAPPPCLLV